jgi:hypothetical protein
MISASLFEDFFATSTHMLWQFGTNCLLILFLFKEFYIKRKKNIQA